MKFVILVSVFVMCSMDAYGQIARPQRAPVIREAVESYSAGNFVVGEIRGSVPNKAIHLPKPDFPNDARWAGAEGEVSVQVVIDNEGNVSRATAVSGPQLLAAVAEDAARRAKFRIVRNSEGQAIETKGVLVYTFEIGKAGWSAVAYGLGGIKFLPVSIFSIPTARKAMSRDWVKELGLLEKLDEIRRAEPPLQPPMFVRQPPSSTTTMRTPSGTMARSTMTTGILGMPRAPHPAQAGLAAELINALQERLETDPLALWKFKVGTVLRDTFELYRNPYERSKAPANIRALIESVPSGDAPEVLTALGELESILGNGKRTMDQDKEIARLYSVVLGSK